MDTIDVGNVTLYPVMHLKICHSKGFYDPWKERLIFCAFVGFVY